MNEPLTVDSSGPRPNGLEEPARHGDVIQLDARHAWGPLVAIVRGVHAAGVDCVVLVPSKPGAPPAEVPLHVDHKDYYRVGAAAWAPVTVIDQRRWFVSDGPLERG